MFGCKKCMALSEEVKFLREQTKALTDRLIAVTSPFALHSLIKDVPDKPSDYYGGGNDLLVGYDDFGQEIALEKDS